MIRRKHSIRFKSQVALEAIRADMTVAEIAKKYQIHPGQVQGWKSEALSKFESIFNKGVSAGAITEEQVAALERKVGQLAVENDFLKKSWSHYQNSKGTKC